MAVDPRTAARLRSTFGSLYATLLEEAPERAAWAGLALDDVVAAIDRARDRVGDPGHALGFRTLLKQELDAICGLTPPPMAFEAPSLPPGRRPTARETRRDRRTRDGEASAHERRRALRAQAARLLRDD